MLSSEKGNAVAELQVPATLYKPADQAAIGTFVQTYLGDATPDVIITGRSGDAANDAALNALEDELFAGKPVVGFKHLSGEFPTASAFAMWMAVQLLRTQQIPEVVLLKGAAATSFKNILIVNQYRGTHYSAMLVKAC
ncbi:hypothetical protein MKQ70_36445 [Chitinophaga sedimenti]|uniref:hypothetical protein n=1 Tax=Chitinophaga sedimenti TaxID=2033606 RepID=UPI002006D194|nr:hypothetical protein [Chitinophaga sedimenti]MCK7560116.1 hypothetical protein [Chitinophaga sedimenti]